MWLPSSDLSKTVVANTKTEGLHPQFYNYVSIMLLLIISSFVRKQIKGGNFIFANLGSIILSGHVTYSPWNYQMDPLSHSSNPLVFNSTVWLLVTSSWPLSPLHIRFKSQSWAPYNDPRSPVVFWTLLVIGSFSLARGWMSPWAVLTGC